MRKLLLLALGGAAAAYVIKSRGGQAAPSPASSGAGYAPGPEAAAEAPPVEEVEPTPADERAEDAAAAEATADTVESDAVIPDTSADDPLVREQEDAAAADAATIGGDPGTVSADVDPAMRPVVEGSGDAEETFEQTEDEGR